MTLRKSANIEEDRDPSFEFFTVGKRSQDNYTAHLPQEAFMQHAVRPDAFEFGLESNSKRGSLWSNLTKS